MSNGASFVPFEGRYLSLREACNFRGDFSRNVKILYTTKIDYVGTYANKLIEEGHEGAIIRDPYAGRMRQEAWALNLVIFPPHIFVLTVMT